MKLTTTSNSEPSVSLATSRIGQEDCTKSAGARRDQKQRIDRKWNEENSDLGQRRADHDR